MPTYNFRHRETGEVIERLMKIVEREEFLRDNPQYESVILGAPSFGDPVRLGLRKPDQGFREVLQKAKAAHPLGKINTF
jgi:hypothetical protein